MVGIRRFWLRTALLATLVPALVACASASDSNINTSVIGRYAVQWKGYVGALEGESVYLRLAFVDSAPDRTNESWGSPTFTGVELLTDKGVVPAVVQAISAQPAFGGFRLFSALVRLEKLGSGAYAFTRVRYLDGPGAAKEVQVGEWVIDVRQGTPADWREDSVTLGGTALGLIEVTLRNVTTGTLLVGGIEGNLPGIVVQSTMGLGLRDSPAPSEPTRPISSLVSRVQVLPGESVALEFAPSVGQDLRTLPFIEFGPFVKYTGARGVGVFPLSTQVYAREFDNDEDLLQYLKLLPARARATLRPDEART